MGHFEDIQADANRIIRAARTGAFQWTKLDPPAPEGGTSTGYSGQSATAMVLAIYFKLDDDREGYEVVITSTNPFMVINVPPALREEFFNKAAAEYLAVQN